MKSNPKTTKKRRYPKPAATRMTKLVTKAQKKRTYKICGGWKSTTGAVCEAKRRVGRRRCGLHGGLTPRGKASTHYVNGRFAKDFSESMRKRIADLDASPVGSLRDHIRVMDARSGQLISELQDAKYDVDTARRVRVLHRRIQGKLDKQENVAKEVGLLLELTGSLAEEADKWVEIKDAFEASRKMVESERKAMHEAKQLMTIEQMMRELNKVMDIVYRFCDRPTIAKIGAAYDREIAGSHIGTA